MQKRELQDTLSTTESMKKSLENEVSKLDKEIENETQNLQSQQSLKASLMQVRLLFLYN